MAAMVLPELFAKTTDFFIKNTSVVLNKHKHLINWKKNPSIFEFGFADGSSSKETLRPLIPSDYKEYVAADVSKPMVEYAIKNVSLPRMEFCQLDIATDNLPDKFRNRFDHIFSFFTIHMVRNPQKAFQNIHNMLKDGGETFHIFYERIPVDPIFVSLSQHPKWGKYNQERMLSPYYDKSKPKEFYEKDIRAAGFKDFHFEETRDIMYTFPNEKILIDLFVSVNATLADIPPHEIEEYKKDYINKIMERIQQSVENKIIPNNLTTKFTLFALSARKN